MPSLYFMNKESNPINFTPSSPQPHNYNDYSNFSNDIIDVSTVQPSIDISCNPDYVSKSEFTQIFLDGSNNSLIVFNGSDSKIKNFFMSSGQYRGVADDNVPKGAKDAVIKKINDTTGNSYTTLNGYDNNFCDAWQTFCQNMNMTITDVIETGDIINIGFTFTYEYNGNDINTIATYPLIIGPDL